MEKIGDMLLHSDCLTEKVRLTKHVRTYVIAQVTNNEKGTVQVYCAQLDFFVNKSPTKDWTSSTEDPACVILPYN